MHYPAATIQSSVLTNGQPIILTLTFSIGADYTNNNLIEIELDILYTGLPVCQYKSFGAISFITYYCSYSNGLLTFNLGN